jgi:hypothetical protein
MAVDFLFLFLTIGVHVLRAHLFPFPWGDCYFLVFCSIPLPRLFLFYILLYPRRILFRSAVLIGNIRRILRQLLSYMWLQWQIRTSY